MTHGTGPFLAAGPKLEEFGAFSTWGRKKKSYFITSSLSFLIIKPILCFPALVLPPPKDHKPPWASVGPTWPCQWQQASPEWTSWCRIALASIHLQALVQLGMSTGSISPAPGPWRSPLWGGQTQRWVSGHIPRYIQGRLVGQDINRLMVNVIKRY